MQLRAAATFQSRYGFIRTGEVFTAEETYGQQLVIGGKATKMPDRVEPSRRQVIPEAPQKKDEPTFDPPPPASESPKEDGQVKRSRSSRRVQVPAGPTPTTLVDAPKRSP